MEPLLSGQAGKKTSAERFDEAQANRRNACFLEMARYFADVEARLRKEDFHRFGCAVAEVQRADEAPDGDVTGARDAALLIISGDADLVARFEEFYRSARVASGKGLAFEKFLCSEGEKGPGWRPSSGKGAGSGSGSS